MCTDLFPGFVVEARGNDGAWRPADLTDNAGRDFAREIRNHLTHECTRLLHGEYVRMQVPNGEPIYVGLQPNPKPTHYEMTFRLNKLPKQRGH